GFFEDALKLNPANWRYLYGAGRTRADTEMLERAAALAPWETNILEALGAAYAAKNQMMEAVRVFRDATRRDPGDAIAFSNLGNALLRTGDKTGAEKAFREA